ncbi:Vomp family autotransporter [Bartonella sp. AR 15-3]|uniref:Vomp family autotransporter n=1 Tax=Bartonella sp. AR 15-3 TaxID=545617 RepID=UPI0001F4C223|nr:Vomp family autotransporter [Bartonella sp. AR 15-3]OPB31190.1 Head domain of trimeric autotransporter adhesin [Bartonella sp. AR 15-3]CBI78801.1 BrpC (modular protein) [Bartonella sp. AR 15-3]
MKKNSTPNIIKTVSLGAVLSVLLSSTSLVFSANLAITGATNQSSNGINSVYLNGSHGSIVLNGDDDYCGVDNVAGRGGTQKPGTAITAEEQYERFINNETFSGRNPYGSSTKKVNWTGEGATEGNVGYMGIATGGVANAMPEAFGVYSFATGCGSYASGNYSTAFGAGATAKAGGAQAFGVSSLATGEASVAMGVGTEATGKSAAAFGSLAKAEGLNSVALGTKAHAEGINSVAVGLDAHTEADGLNSVALGYKAHAYVEGAVAIGHDSVAGTRSSVAIGSGAQVTVENGVALGGNSVAVTPYGIAGYDPRVNGNSTIDDFVWKSTKGVVSVGNPQHGVTRQIVGVAAGTDLSDAVNVAQLQALRDMILTGGNNLVQQDGGTGVITIGSDVNGDTIDIVNNDKQSRKISGVSGGAVTEESTEAVNGAQLWETNGKISELDNEINSIETNITKIQTDVTKIATNTSKYFGGGANVLDGTAPTYTINGSKYNDVGSAFEGVDTTFTEINNKISTITENSLVQQNIDTKVITIGKGRGGTTIDISDSPGQDRTLSGVKAAVQGNEAVNKDQLDKRLKDITQDFESVSAAAVLYDKKSDGSIDYNKITLGGQNNNEGPVAIRNLKDGKISNESSDAVNGKQIYELSQDIADIFGGGTDFNNGSFTRPVYTLSHVTTEGSITSESYNDVGSAFAGLDVNIKNMNAHIKYLVNNFDEKISNISNDALLWSEEERAFVALHGSKGQEKQDSRLTFLLDGEIDVNSTDAINGGQLWQVASNTSKYLGGDADVLAGTAPTYTINGSQYNDVGSAFKGVDTTFTEINNKISNITENSLVQQDAAQDNIITIGAETEGIEIHVHNNVGKRRRIVGVLGGAITKESSEVVNGGQLWETERVIEELDYNTSKYFGGGADVLLDKAPTYTINGSQYNDVGSAFEGVDTTFTEINNKITTITENSLVQQDLTQDITIGAKTAGTLIDITNSEGESRLITGIEDGDISNQSTDAINGYQLWQVASNTSKYFGGGANVLHGTAPTYTINGSKYNDVGSAFEGVDTTFMEINNKITTITENSLVQQDLARNITIGAKTGGTLIDIANSEGESRLITGVEDGDVSNQSTDAINGYQLWQVASNTSKYLGGGADVLSGKAPTYIINGSLYNNVGSAFEGVDLNFTEIRKEILNMKENNLVQQDEENSIITIGKESGGGTIHIVNNKNQQRKISGVSDGAIAEESTEAINGSQLWETNDRIVELNKEINGIDANISNIQTDLTKVATNTSEYFGGGANVLDGKAPTYIINGSRYNDVGSAFEGVDTTFTEINNKISNITANSLVQQERSNGLITIGKNVNGTEISVLNNTKKQRKITGIASGLIFEKSTDAVNGGQLWETNQEVFELNNSVEKAETDITNLQGDLSKVAVYTSNYLGGGADVLGGKAPTYTINGSKYNDVGSAFKGVDGSIKDIRNQILDITENSLVQQNIDTKVITIGKGKGGTTINISDSPGQDRTLSGVKAAVQGNEAVNKDQLDKRLKDITQDFESVSAAAVFYDKKSDGSIDYNKITLGGQNNNEGPVAIRNLKDGKISNESSDAVNGKQIYELSQDIADIFGGGTDFNNGSFTRPVYTLSHVTTEGIVTSENYNDVGSAFAGLDVNIKNMNAHIKYLVNNFDEKISNISNDALLWSEEERAFVALHGSKGQEKQDSRLTFLLDGEIDANSTDAINGGQLFQMSNKLASYFGGGAQYENGEWRDPIFKIYRFGANGSTSEKVYKDVASAFAGVNGGMSILNDRIKKIENQSGQGGSNSDALKWSEEKGAYDANREGKDSKITGVANGKVEKDSKEAVNGGQLWDTNERVTNVENKVDNMSNTINGIAENTVQYDKDANGKKNNKITLAGGDAGQPVVIDNIADGKIEKGSKEAVNGGQLHDYTKQQMEIVLDDAKKYTDEKVKNIVVDAIDDAVEKAKDYTDKKFGALNYNIEGVRKEARQAAAIGLAVSNLRYNTTPGALSVAFGTGLWRSQSAFAFGAGYTSINGNIRSNVSVTGAGGHWGVGAGFSFTLPVR